MEQALDILDRSLRGDTGALSFLERTASIYVLNYNAEGKHTTYGCWDFMNQALNEIERFENDAARAGYIASTHIESHVQLLCTMCQRAARRGPETDRRLIGTCLLNAGIDLSRMVGAQELVDFNCQMRERVMGRLATSAFDFSYHNLCTSHSVFSHPLTMEKLCGVLAANVIASGPSSLRMFAMEWIIPSATSMPSFSVVAIILYIGNEGLSNSVPVGTGKMLSNLSKPFVAQVVGPILADALRESDNSQIGNGMIGNINSSDRNNFNHKLSALALRSLERWCTVVYMRVDELQKICADSKFNIIEVISDALYSNAEIVVDAVADLIDTVLGGKMQSMIMLEKSFQSAPLKDRNQEQVMNDENVARDEILTELISAIGLQRFRFVGRQTAGDIAVCRCLTRVASSVALSSRHLIREKLQQGKSDGIIDLLLHAASHFSVHINGIALEVLPLLLVHGSNLADRLLPTLQQRTSWPVHLTVDTVVLNDSKEDCGVDFDEFESFRESILGDALTSCYTYNRQKYLISCVAVIDQICTSHARGSWRQLEAALFCINAVSLEACKRAALVSASPAAQIAAAKASTIKKGNIETSDIAQDAKQHDKLLSQCITSLAKSPDVASCNPLVLAQMCRFIGRFSNWFAKSSSSGVLDLGAKLALDTFQAATTAFRDDGFSQEIIDLMSISPFTEAAEALRRILSRSPDHFTTPQALAALAGGWDASYAMLSTENGNCTSSVTIEDRELLCSGICRVLAALSYDKWTPTLSALAKPTVTSIETVVRHIDEMSTRRVAETSPGFLSALTRGGEEIRILSTMIRTFNNAAAEQIIDAYKDSNMDKSYHFEHPSLMILHRIWPCLSYVAQHFSQHNVIANALGEILTNSITVIARQNHDSISLLKQICETGAIMMSQVAGSSATTASLAPAFQLIMEIIDVFGAKAESSFRSNAPQDPVQREYAQLIQTLLNVSSEAVSLAVGNIWSHGKEQGGGQNSVEGLSMENKHKEKKSSDALAGMFSTLKKCIELCPVLLVQMEGVTIGSSSLFVQSVEAATVAVNDQQVDAARCSTLYLKSVVELRDSIGKENTISSDSPWSRIAPAVAGTISRIRQKLTERLIYGVCGHFAREILDPAALLLHAILVRSPATTETESMIVSAMRQEQFLLGDEARMVAYQILGQCSSGGIASTVLIDFITDLWAMHESDDTGGTAGGDAVKNLEEKYCS